MHSNSDSCFVCGDSANGRHIATNTAVYHPECFKCHHCLRSFPNNVFFETDTGVYCEPDYNMLCLARCAGCTEPITTKCISALDAKWHLEHFCCSNCGRSLVGSNFVKRDDKPFCKLCPTNKEKAKIKRIDEVIDVCDHCKTTIAEFPILFKGKKVHGHHFNCHFCHRVLDHSAREFNGNLYCFMDYEKVQSQVCYSCRQHIVGYSVSAMGRVYHPEHFLCFKCEKPFNGTQYYEHENKPYCEVHFKAVTGAVCQYCREAVRGKDIAALGGKWCENHFQCLGCFVNLANLERSKFLDFDLKPFCRRCHDQLPGEVKRNMVKYREKEKKYAATS